MSAAEETKEAPLPGFMARGASAKNVGARAPAPGFAAVDLEGGQGIEEAPQPGFAASPQIQQGGLHTFEDYKNYFISEMKHPTFVQSILSEFWATSIFLFFLIMSCLPGKMGGQEIFRIGVTGGFMIAILVYAFYAVSGGNINPAVSFGLALSGRMTWPRACGYIVAQCLGAIAGVAMCRAVSPAAFRIAGGGANAVGSLVLGDTTVKITVGQALWAEIMGTMLLVLAVLFCTDTARSMEHPHMTTLIPLEIGLVVLVCHLILIPIDGCSINPARSLGSAVIAWKWNHHYVFWLGPMIGAGIAAVIYKLVFAPTDIFNKFLDDTLTTQGERLSKGTASLSKHTRKLTGDLTNLVRRGKSSEGGQQ